MKKEVRIPKESVPDVEVAAAVREACVEAALAAYENARMDGLCRDGAWEAAVSALRMLDVDRIVAQMSDNEGR